MASASADHEFQNGQIVYQTGFVVILDVLGFKLYSDEEADNAYRILERSFKVMVENNPHYGTEEMKHWLSTPHVRMFQDTIIIAFPIGSQGTIGSVQILVEILRGFATLRFTKKI